MPKVSFISLGCPKNLVDTEVMLGMLCQQGFEITNQQSEAEILVVNTCGFIDAAQQESVDAILEATRWKEEGKCKKLIVAGCLVERFRDEILKEIPQVDAVIGPNQVPQIVALCSQASDGLFAEESPFLYDETTPRVLTTGRHFTYLKVAEGCDHGCTFCVIPQLKGKFRSRRPSSVVSEANQMARQGVKEINLIAQDTTLYGHDLEPRATLSALLRQLNDVDGIEWIRLLYCYPHSTTDELLEAVARLGKVCKYFDIPFQHASAKILKLMKRGGNAEFLLRLVEKVRRCVSDVTLRSTMIVGFPGETEEDFEMLIQFVKQAQLDRLGVFLYSDEDASAAFHLGEKVPRGVARKRRDRLMRLQQKISLQKNHRWIGKRVRAIVDGPSVETELLWQARMQGQAPDIDGHILINDGPENAFRAGEFVTLEINDAHPYDLVGRIVG
ncbi:MAG: 30S ribosomal protein S12 methylthiotransferase RimO [Acidobacteria bacterium]|nr:30S ribosomal protein S12 methylthiotransferase RimO [Acidobacteriota bacterium]